VSVECDSYVFVALLQDSSLHGPPIWMVQRLRVDPSDGDDGELVVGVTERCHVDARENHIAFEDRYTIGVPLDDADRPPRVTSIREALERQYVVCEGCGRHSSARIVDDEVVVFTPDRWCECGAEEGTRRAE
jgi:hypothetical protein